MIYSRARDSFNANYAHTHTWLLTSSSVLAAIFLEIIQICFRVSDLAFDLKHFVPIVTIELFSKSFSCGIPKCIAAASIVSHPV